MNKQNQDFHSLFYLGTRMLHQGKPKEALPYLQKAHQLQPEHIDAGINLSGAYILTKKFKKAVGVLEPLSEQNPDQSMVWINLGAAYLGNPVLAQTGDQERAIFAFQNALRLDPAANSVAYNLGLIYRDRRDIEEAVYWFGQAIEHDPQDEDARRLLDKMKSEYNSNEDVV